jgi:hypothetical protein
LPQRQQPTNVLLQRRPHSRTDIGCRREDPRQVVINGLVGNLVGNHVTDDMRDEVWRGVRSEGLVGFHFVNLK